MKSPISHYKGVFSWFKSIFEVCFGLVLISVGNILVKSGKDASFQFQADASPPRRRYIRLGEPQNSRSLPRLGKGCFTLAKVFA